MGRAQVLIVEDDPWIQNLIVEFLTDEGIPSVVARDGRSGVELARSEQPDIILMDLMLPVMDGMTAIRQLKDDPRTRHIRTIAMSAGTNLRLHAEHLPADGILSKPFDLDTLLAAVLLATSRAGPRNDGEFDLAAGGG
jgi:CheY-like chemotaxis protein